MLVDRALTTTTVAPAQAGAYCLSNQPLRCLTSRELLCPSEATTTKPILRHRQASLDCAPRRPAPCALSSWRRFLIPTRAVASSSSVPAPAIPACSRFVRWRRCAAPTSSSTTG
ncbi:hypothetical protein SPHINGO8AM_40070 [Sphingomonas sp. 8AM]|nr:hypothetical protein SPHINGO8AM_40070 [Sphingomonas sp. 8AM]